MESKEAILKKFGVDQQLLLGKGGEGEVYEIDSGRVLKIYKNPDTDYLQGLMQFQKQLNDLSLPFAVPQITELGEGYSIEKRLQGQTLDKVFPSLNKDEQKTALTNYFQVMKKINNIEFPDSKFGQVLSNVDAVQTESWPEFLTRKMDQEVEKSGEYLRNDVTDFDNKLARLKQLIVNETDTSEKYLVHADYYLNNVLVDDNMDVTAVLDFSIHTLVGDPRLDAASILFLTMDKNIKPEQIEMIYQLAETEYGVGTRRILDIYGMYYSIYYSSTHDHDPDSYKWCINNLNNEETWSRFEPPFIHKDF